MKRPDGHPQKRTRSPKGVLKPSKIKWGYASDIFCTLGISCRMTTLESVKYAVGPYGKCDTTRPSTEEGDGCEQRLEK